MPNFDGTGPRGIGRGRNQNTRNASRVFRIEFSDPEYDFEKTDVELAEFLDIYDLSDDPSVLGAGILSLEDQLLFLDVEKPYGSRVRGKRGFEEVELEYRSKLPDIKRVYRTDAMRGRGYFADPRGECPDPV